MKNENTIKVVRLADGGVFQELEDGSRRQLRSKSDRSRLDALTEEEIEANAQADADNPPFTDEELSRLRPVTQARRVRTQLHLTQEQFAHRFHLPLGTVRDWELGRREPETAAKNFLRVIEHDPEVVIAALKSPSGTAR